MLTDKDIKAAMSYGSVIAETLNVVGYEIDIWQDSDCGNPYDDDGMSPALWLSADRHGGLTEYGKGNLESFFDHVTHAWVSRHWRAIAHAMDMPDLNAFDAECRDHAADYGNGLSDARCDMFIDYLHDMRSASWGHGVDYLECLRALYTLAKIPAETFQRNGYSQGDSVYGLIVMTPAWVEKVGASHAKPGKLDMPRCAADMKAQADEYGAWAWGDCYGFTVTYPQGDVIDSCGGFIASDDGEYMISAIVDAINSDMRHKEAARLDSLKTYIRNRVPLETRATLMSQHVNS